MATKNDFYALMKNDNPKWLGDPWDCFVEGPALRPLVFDAASFACGQPRPGTMRYTNALGITWTYPADQPGATVVSDEEAKLIKDITCWEDFLHFPDPKAFDWTVSDMMAMGKDRSDKIFMVPSFCGLFEFTHATMGFEDALVNFLEEPDHMNDLISAYTDFKIQCAQEFIDHWHPDMVHSQDDWGSKDRMFLPPTVWRELIKPHYTRYYKFLKENGVIIQHHNDGYSADIAVDMVEMGIDIWQGCLPSNNIPEVIERTEGKLCILGGIDTQVFDFPNADEALVRGEVRRAIDEYCPCGSFIPCATNVVPVHKENEIVMNDELNRYGAEYAAKHFGK